MLAIVVQFIIYFYLNFCLPIFFEADGAEIVKTTYTLFTYFSKLSKVMFLTHLFSIFNVI